MMWYRFHCLVRLLLLLIFINFAFFVEHFYGRSTSNPKHFFNGNESKNASLPQNLACLGLSIGFIFFVSSLLSSVDFRMSGSNFYFQFSHRLYMSYRLWYSSVAGFYQEAFRHITCNLSGCCIVAFIMFMLYYVSVLFLFSFSASISAYVCSDPSPLWNLTFFIIFALLH